MKNYKTYLWNFLTELGVWSFGRYYTEEGAEGYNWLCDWIDKNLKEEGFNICKRNIKRIVKVVDNGGDN